MRDFLDLKLDGIEQNDNSGMLDSNRDRSSRSIGDEEVLNLVSQSSVVRLADETGTIDGSAIVDRYFSASPSTLQTGDSFSSTSKTDAADLNDLISGVVDLSSVIDQWGRGEGTGNGSGGCGGCGACPDCTGGGCGGCGVCPTCTGSGSGFAPNPRGAEAFVNLDQTVFLDFDSGEDGNVNYTTQMREAVQAQMETIFEAFGVTFVQEAPEEGDFSTLVFNSGTQGGLAEDIDFRNLNKNDNAVLNVEGLGSTEAEDISASAVIGAHELGHILGLRHHDAFGPIAGGIPDNLFFPGFSPIFPGPELADETRDHIMNTPALAGEFFDTFSPSWFGEREAIKLTFAANGTVVSESGANNDSFGTAEEFELVELLVPNTIVVGDNAGDEDFQVGAVAVVGTFDANDPADYYRFEAQQARVYSFEVISDATDRYGLVDPIDSMVSIFDSNFEAVDYFGTPAVNDNDVEFGGDAHLFDLQLPTAGTYYVRVDNGFAGDTGTYELFVSAFGVPLSGEDDFTDLLSITQAQQFEFTQVSNNLIGRLEGAIGFEGNAIERDVFTFTLDSRARVIVDVRATTAFLNAFVEVFDVDGNRIDFNDNSGNPALANRSDSQLTISSLSAGEYFVVVSGSAGTTGQYRVAVRHNGPTGSFDDHGDSFGSATNFGLNPVPSTTFITADAELGNDIDTFRFTAIATGQMVIRSRALSGNINTVLRSYDSDRNLLETNNNFNGSLDSKITLDVVQGESYFIKLGTVRETTGDYRLSFRTLPGALTNGGGGSNSFSLDRNVDLNFGEQSQTASATAGYSCTLGMMTGSELVQQQSPIFAA